MKNLKRYFIFAEGDIRESELTIIADKSGEWVHFSDVEEMLNTSTNKQSTAVAQIADDMEEIAKIGDGEPLIHIDWVNHWIRQLRTLS